MNIGVGRLQRMYHKCLTLVFGDRVFYDPSWRWIFSVPLPVYQPHSYLLYELNPDWRSPCGGSRHNSHGLRGQPVKIAPSDNKTRIMCMGESSTYCTGISADKDTYPARLEHYLRQAGKSVEVLNAGVGGYTSLENLMYYHMRIRYFKPNLLIYYFTHNDVHPRRFPSLSTDYREYSRSWYEPHHRGGLVDWWTRRMALGKGDVGRLVRRYSEFHGRRQATNTEINLPTVFRANIRALLHMVLADGVKCLVVLPNYLGSDEAVDGSRQVKNPAWRSVWEHREVVLEMKVEGLCDCFDLVDKISYPNDHRVFPTGYYQDPAHFTEQGADLAGSQLAKYLLGRKWAKLFNQHAK